MPYPQLQNNAASSTLPIKPLWINTSFCMCFLAEKSFGENYVPWLMRSLSNRVHSFTRRLIAKRRHVFTWGLCCHSRDRLWCGWCTCHCGWCTCHCWWCIYQCSRSLLTMLVTWLFMCCGSSSFFHKESMFIWFVRCLFGALILDFNGTKCLSFMWPMLMTLTLDWTQGRYIASDMELSSGLNEIMWNSVFVSSASPCTARSSWTSLNGWHRSAMNASVRSDLTSVLHTADSKYWTSSALRVVDCWQMPGISLSTELKRQSPSYGTCECRSKFRSAALSRSCCSCVLRAPCSVSALARDLAITLVWNSSNTQSVNICRERERERERENESERESERERERMFY